MKRGKTFASEQKIRELKTRISKIARSKVKNKPYQNNSEFSLEHEPD